MTTFFNNLWTIAIVGSIISGISVFIITEKIFKKRLTKELLENIRIANSEIIYAIRPLVIDKIVPDQKIINALISSTAKKYSVDIKNLMIPKEISEHLIKEILDNSFISAEAKLEYSSLIFDIHLNQENEDKINKVNELEYPSTAEFSTTNISLMISMFAASLTAAFFIYDSPIDIFGILQSQKQQLLTLMLSVSVAILIASLFANFLESKKKVNDKNIAPNKTDGEH